MKRRQFLGVLGATTIAWPLAARAQQAEQMRHIGVLVGLAPDENGQAAAGFLRGFRDAMQQSGWIEGKNIRIDYRFGGTLADLTKTDASAAELVALHPELIYSQGLPATLGAVAGLVGIRVGVVSGVINLELSGVEASDWRLRHEQGYHEA